MTAPKTVQVDGETYLCHDRRPFTPWHILVKKDGNERHSVPVYRTGWEQGGEVEIFSLLPADGCGDTLLVQIRIYTQANANEHKPGVPAPQITAECNVPAFLFVQPEKQRVLLTLLCQLEAQPRERRLLVKPDPQIEVVFAQAPGEEG